MNCPSSNISGLLGWPENQFTPSCLICFRSNIFEHLFQLQINHISSSYFQSWRLGHSSQLLLTVWFLVSQDFILYLLSFFKHLSSLCSEKFLKNVFLQQWSILFNKTQIKAFSMIILNASANSYKEYQSYLILSGSVHFHIPLIKSKCTTFL